MSELTFAFMNMAFWPFRQINYFIFIFPMACLFLEFCFWLICRLMGRFK